MNIPKLDLVAIQKWAYSTVQDEEYDQYQEDEPDHFDIVVSEACSLVDLFKFSSDRKCLKRGFFARLLITELAWIYRTRKELPFHTSRFQGIMNKEEYLEKVKALAESVYERAVIIERMRVCDDPASQAMADTLLNYRNDLLDSTQKEYIALVRAIHFNVVPLFNNA